MFTTQGFRECHNMKLEFSSSCENKQLNVLKAKIENSYGAVMKPLMFTLCCRP